MNPTRSRSFPLFSDGQIEQDDQASRDADENEEKDIVRQRWSHESTFYKDSGKYRNIPYF